MNRDRPDRLLVVVPNWVGDVVLATPVLRALREGLPQTHIRLLLRPHLREVLDGHDFFDALEFWPARRGLGGIRPMATLAARLRRQRFDAAVLLTHSFRSALLAWRARIGRRIGYARDGRAWLLTDRLRWPRADGRFRPVPMTTAYARLIEPLGCKLRDPRPRLEISPQQLEAGQALLRHYGLKPKRYAVIAPGAAFGAAKCWLPERFAGLIDVLHRRWGLAGVLAGAPGEYALLERIAGLARSGPIVCRDPGTTLGTLKLLVRDAALLVCNDSGPRHYGIALGTPTVTIFGPTDPAWTETHCPHEVQVRMDVPCGPCQLRRCPLDHRCMRAVTVEQVAQAAEQARARGKIEERNQKSEKSWGTISPDSPRPAP